MEKEKAEPRDKDTVKLASNSHPNVGTPKKEEFTLKKSPESMINISGAIVSKIQKKKQKNDDKGGNTK